MSTRMRVTELLTRSYYVQSARWNCGSWTNDITRSSRRQPTSTATNVWRQATFVFLSCGRSNRRRSVPRCGVSLRTDTSTASIRFRSIAIYRPSWPQTTSESTFGTWRSPPKPTVSFWLRETPAAAVSSECYIIAPHSAVARILIRLL